MSDNLLGTIINGVFALAVALIGAVVIDIRRKAIRIRRQVENDHPTNLREEQDERHQENTQAIALLTQGMNNLTKNMDVLREDSKQQRHDFNLLVDYIMRRRISFLRRRNQ